MAVFKTERWRVTTDYYIQSGTWFNIEFYTLVGGLVARRNTTAVRTITKLYTLAEQPSICLSISPTTALHDMFLPLHITSGQQQNQMIVSWVKQTSQQPTTNNY